MARKPPTGAAWAPARHELPDAAAIKALQSGTATADQQQRALKWIIEEACRTYDLSFRPQSSRETDFAEGRRFVGLEIVKLLNIPAEAYRRGRAEPSEQP